MRDALPLHLARAVGPHSEPLQLAVITQRFMSIVRRHAKIGAGPRPLCPSCPPPALAAAFLQPLTAAGALQEHNQQPAAPWAAPAARRPSRSPPPLRRRRSRTPSEDAADSEVLHLPAAADCLLWFLL